jgi:hypothetical protein
MLAVSVENNSDRGFMNNLSNYIKKSYVVIMFAVYQHYKSRTIGRVGVAERSIGGDHSAWRRQRGN